MGSLEKLPVHEVMTGKPITARLETSVTEAATLMRDENVGGLVVLDEDRPVGVVTERDIVQKVVAPRRLAEETRVQDVMSAPVITTGPNADTADAARLMAKHRVRRLPVVNGRALIGMLTDRDILVISPALFEIARGVSEIRAERLEPQEGIEQPAKCEGCDRLTDGLRIAGGELLCEDCLEGRS